MLLEHCARRHLFGSVAVAALFLGALLDVFVLALLFGAYARKMLLLFAAFAFRGILLVSLSCVESHAFTDGLTFKDN
jgi:hypothetical protein